MMEWGRISSLFRKLFICLDRCESKKEFGGECLGGEWKASMRTRSGLAGDPGNKERINMLYMHVCVCVRGGQGREKSKNSAK